MSDPTTKRGDGLNKLWKHVGYKNYTRLVGLDANFFYVRQFRTLNVRIVLAMQDQITELEEQLDRLDQDLSKDDAPDIHNGSFRQETSRERLELIWTIQRRLRDYNVYLDSYSRIGTRSHVAARDIQSVQSWTKAFPKAIHDEELGYLKRSDDLIYVNPKSDSALRRLFTGVASRGLPWFRRHPSDTQGYDQKTTFLHDEERAEVFFTRLTIVAGLLMLIGPIWILEFVAGPLQRLGVITAFILLFLFLVSFATTARPFESLAAAAAYSAVLMVFLQVEPYTRKK